MSDLCYNYGFRVGQLVTVTGFPLGCSEHLYEVEKALKNGEPLVVVEVDHMDCIIGTQKSTEKGADLWYKFENIIPYKMSYENFYEFKYIRFGNQELKGKLEQLKACDQTDIVVNSISAIEKILQERNIAESK